MGNKLFVLIFVLVLLVLPLVSSAGNCVLDKEFYHPGETLLFSCSCTLPLEENQGGFIVVLNSSGDILQNNSADSGLCRSSFFTDTYSFVAGDDYIGNVTFSLLGNGTGTPTNWGDAGDVISDDFNVSGASVFDCIINDVSSIPPALGDVGSVKVTVTDALTGNSLVHVACQAEAYNINSTPLIFEPYGPGETVRFTGSGGEVGFQRDMSELFWEIDTTYLFEFHCHCLDNSSDMACYDETSGEKVGFKSCTAKTPFVTGVVDNRGVDKGFLPVVWTLIFTSLFFLAIGFLTPKIGFKLAGFGVGIIELVILAFLVWINRTGNSIIGLLEMNFYILLILGFGIGFIGLILFVIRIMNPKDELEDGGLDKKWGKD